MWLLVLLVAVSPALAQFDDLLRAVRPRADSVVQTNAARALAARLLGDDAGSFDITVDPSVAEDGKDTFRITGEGGKVRVVGSTGVAAAWGLHHYLKNYCGCHISWDGDQLALPSVLPDVNETVTAKDPIRYYQNVCTVSYSFAWYSWERWEREVDWMALMGINMALAFTGQEAIWQRVYDGLGLPSADFTGPAFLAWLRMGNMRVFGGGLTAAWHTRSLELQHRILDRMRSLGIIPVLPAFAGPVPPSFSKVYPNASVRNMSQWNNFPEEFCCPLLLDPNDPMFQVVARVFLREYTEEFGTDHVYNCDTFNENTPDSNDADYLASTAEAIFNGIQEVDPAGVWMLQGWMFVNGFWSVDDARAYLSRIPLGRLLVLDLQSDLTPQYTRLESYFGHAFVWNTLHNYGGQLGLYGHLEKVNKGVVEGRTFPNSTMVGVGIAPEGIDQNYIMYEFTLDSTLRDEEVNLTEWVSAYARRRYGIADEHLDEAWQILKSTMYNYTESTRHRLGFSRPRRPMPVDDHIAKNILTKTPSPYMSEVSWYDRRVVMDVFTRFLTASSDAKVAASPLFQHDLVDVTRQTIQNAVSLLYLRVIKEFRERDLPGFRNSSALFLDILPDLDTVLASGRKFLLGSWLESAKQCATTDNETAQYEYNARNQITLWGPNGQISDYAAKQWSGMVADYYAPRWQVFVNYLTTVMEDPSSNYNSTIIRNAMFQQVELPFSSATKVYPSTPSGDPVQVVNEFYTKWKPVLEDIFSHKGGRRKLLSDISVTVI